MNKAEQNEKIAKARRILKNATMALTQKCDRETPRPLVREMLEKCDHIEISKIFLALAIHQNLGDDAVDACLVAYFNNKVADEIHADLEKEGILK